MIKLIIILLILFAVYYVYLAPVELDDVHPHIKMSQSLFDKSGWLWVIPLYNNEPISNHTEWVKMIKNSGKKIGMHGVKHTFAEFDKDLTPEYIDAGLEEYKKAFGRYPEYFKAPKLLLTPNNRKYLESKGVKIRGIFEQATNKVLHTEDDRDNNGGRLTYEN